MVKSRLLPSLALAAAMLSASSITTVAADDDYLTMAKAYVAKVTAPGAPWTGPNTGPKAQGKKLIVYVSSDQRNGGPQERATARRRRPN